jgi:hypothetical protein
MGILVSFLLLTQLGFASEPRTVIYDGNPVTVTLETGQPTILVFPTAIARVPTGFAETDLNVSIHQRSLVLHPRVEKLQGRLIVETAAGRQYQIVVTTVTQQRGQPKPDSEVRVSLPVKPTLSVAAPTFPGQPFPRRSTPTRRSLVRAILVSMWTAAQRPPLSGVTMIPTERVLTDQKTHLVRIVRIYQAPPYYGYTLEVHNRQDQPWPLLISQIEDDGLLVIAADPLVLPNQPRPPVEVIPARGRGLLHLIYQGRP